MLKAGVLTRLSAQNFSLLHNVSVEFGPGLNVISGESGAGKSLVIDALLFALGKRSNQTYIGVKGDECEVSAVFDLNPATARACSLAPTVEIKRMFGRSGRSSLFVNGEVSKVNDLRELFASIVDISTQFAQQDIFRTVFHREVLDSFGDSGFASALAEYCAGFHRLKELRDEIGIREAALARGTEEKNYLEFLVAELAAAGVGIGEKDRITTELYVLEHSEDILRRSGNAARLLYDGEDTAPSAFDLMAQASRELGALSDSDMGKGKITRALELIEEALGGIGEAKQIIGEMADVPDYSPAEIERLRKRVDELNALEHKYRIPADELPALLETSRSRLDVLSTSPEELDALKAQAKKLGGELMIKAQKLNDSRRAIGAKLAANVRKYLSKLGFKQAEFIADITEPEEPDADDLRDYGLGRVEFIISLNPGEPARPLAEVASGGEASRLMLAVKAALQRKLSYATIVFDEIEAGVGGDAAFDVANVLRDLAVNHQVIAVTHLAPVAAAGEQHLEAVKTVRGGNTDIKVIQLNGDARIKSLARMLGDAEHPESLALAEDFLRRMA